MQIPQIKSADLVTDSYQYSGSKDSSQTSTFHYLFINDSSQNVGAIDPDLWTAINAIKSSDLSGMQQALMLDILAAAALIRKQNMDITQQQAVNSLNSGLASADFQELQAKKSAINSIITSVATGLQAGIELAATAGSAANTWKQTRAINAEADTYDWTKSSGDVDGDGPAATPKPTEPPPAYSATNPLVDINGETLEMGDLPANPELKAAGSGGAPTPDDADGATDADGNGPIIDDKARAQFIADRQKILATSEDMKVRIATTTATLIGSLMKSAGAQAEIDAGIAQADATVQQALQTYLLNQSQSSNSYAQEIQQFMTQILEYIKSVEQARHQAASSIANAA